MPVHRNPKEANPSAVAAVLVAIAAFITPQAFAEQFSKFDRDRVQGMLQQIAVDVKKHYYDANFHGLDWDANVRQAKERIDRADGLNRALSEVAAALDALNDSHTFFRPPERPFRHDYGWQIQIVGERCYVIRVRPGSDPETKRIKPGDEVLSINSYPPVRDNLWKMEYVFNVLRPQPGLHVALRDPSGNRREVDILAKITQLKRVTDLTGKDFWERIREEENEQHLMRARSAEVGAELMLLKLPLFHFSEMQLDGMIGDARKHKALILDLRANPGGAVDTLTYLIGCLFDREVTIGDRVGRESRKPMVAKAHGHSVFAGKLVVLVDSRSASAAEVLARVIQIEKRGVVVGDRTSGSVMEAKHYSYRTGMGTVVPFGASITDADMVMTDGKSLEHTGVSPDETSVPTSADLASGRDPVLARAAQILDVKLTPEDAGKMFPYEWPKE